METNFEQRLTGGHPNSLGNTIEVVEEVLADSSKLEELFNCYHSQDEVVRLRVSNALKRVGKEHKDWLAPFIPQLIDDIALINQASTQWTLAQLFDMLKEYLTPEQERAALEIMQNNLANHQDWIVLNTSMDVLIKWNKKHSGLKDWLMPHLERLAKDERKSVSKKATKGIVLLTKN